MSALNRCLSRTLVAVSLLAVAHAACAAPLAESRAESDPVTAAAPLAPDELERACSICDYIGTTEGVLAAPIALCTTVTRELEQTKFGGDHERMLAWWRENKPAEFSKLDRLRHDLAERDVDTPTI